MIRKRNGSAFLFVANCIRTSDSPTEPWLQRRATGPTSWDRIITAALNQCVAHLVARLGFEKGALKTAPDEVLELFALCEKLAQERHLRIKDQLLEYGALLRQKKVMPIALKGCVNLFYDSYFSPLMSDIDLLVPPSSVDICSTVAETLRYRICPETEQCFVLSHPDHGVEIDLHFGLETGGLLESGIEERSEPIPGTCLTRLSPTDSILHNVYHSQVHHRFGGLRILSLQQMFNLFLMMMRDGDEIDWSFVHRRFERASLGAELRNYLYSASQLLGLKIPNCIVCGYPERIYLRSALNQMDSPLLRNFVFYKAVVMDGLLSGDEIRPPLFRAVGQGTQAVRRRRLGLLRKIQEVKHRRFRRFE